jgi:pectate lyase
LFGSHPTDYYDRNLRITVAYNKFGPGLIQRMPR